MLRMIYFSWKIITIFERQSLVKSRTVPSLETLYKTKVDVTAQLPWL
jgi:hypothetical protein